jgi:hypothetical protein
VDIRTSPQTATQAAITVVLGESASDTVSELSCVVLFSAICIGALVVEWSHSVLDEVVVYIIVVVKLVVILAEFLAMVTVLYSVDMSDGETVDATDGSEVCVLRVVIKSVLWVSPVVGLVETSLSVKVEYTNSGSRVVVYTSVIRVVAPSVVS